MKKITICDDNIEDLKHIEKLLTDYLKRSKETYEMEVHSDSNKLFQELRKRELSDIYILDMLMPIKSGIELAEAIRKLSIDPVIIYTTSSKEFALEAYGVKAARYLVKPVTSEPFFEAMRFAVVCVSKEEEEPVYMVKTQEGIVSLPFSRIEYIENKARRLQIHLEDKSRVKSLFIRKSFEAEIESLIESGQFLQIHKSFAVHLKYAGKLTSDSMIMENGGLVPISKKKYTEVKRKYLQYMVEQYR